MPSSNFPYIYFDDSTYEGGTYLDGTYSDGTYIDRRYDPVQLSYSIWYITPDGSHSQLTKYRYREPVRESVGYYYSSMEMPEQPGNYELRWLFQRDNSSFNEQLIQSFSIASDGIKPLPDASTLPRISDATGSVYISPYELAHRGYNYKDCNYLNTVSGTGYNPVPPFRQGQTGIQGATGVRGIDGITGARGIDGVTGISGIPLDLPTDYARLDNTSFDTTSSSFVDILTASITLDSSAYIHGLMTFESVSVGAGDYATGGFRVVISDSSGDELYRYIQDNAEVSIGSVQHRAGPYDSGTYIAKGQVCQAGGSKTLRVNDAQLWLQGQQGTQGIQGHTGVAGVKGTTGIMGPTGFQGLTGPRGFTGAGIQGETGLRGPTGFQGLTGTVGFTGAGIQGETGLRGPTGFQGLTGPRGFTGAGIQGETGLRGPTGFQGLTGPIGFTGAGIQGETGFQGAQGLTGLYGFTGAGIQGETGLRGPTGFQGLTGPIGFTGAGIQGETGFQGAQGLTGIRGFTGAGIQGETGLHGSTGNGLQGTTGLQGVTGAGSSGGGSQIIFDPVSRYSAVSTSGEEVLVVSSSSIYTGLSWARTTTSLTMSRDSHGHSSGDRVIIRNTNNDYQVTTIDSTTANSFIITTADIGGISGTAGAYSLGFTYAHNGSPKTGGTVYAPSGDHADVQLLTLRIRTGMRAGTTYDVIVPPSAINGAGTNTSLSNCFIPDYNIRADADALSTVGATIATNISGSYSTFQIAVLGTLSRIIILHF